MGCWFRFYLRIPGFWRGGDGVKSRRYVASDNQDTNGIIDKAPVVRVLCRMHVDGTKVRDKFVW